MEHLACYKHTSQQVRQFVLQMARILLLLAVLAVFNTAANAQTLNETDLVAGVNMTTLTMQRVNYTADIPLNVGFRIGGDLFSQKSKPFGFGKTLPLDIGPAYEDFPKGLASP